MKCRCPTTNSRAWWGGAGFGKLAGIFVDVRDPLLCPRFLRFIYGGFE